ncbi:MAG: SAM-dependent methyltransferase [Bacteroidales bacterium]
MITGQLFLIPSFLSDNKPSHVFPEFNLEMINSLDEFIVEDVRTARRFLRKIGYKQDFEQVKFHVLDKYTDLSVVPGFLVSALDGKDVGLLSEAGVPCIADPGAIVVELAHQKNIKVVPLIGPSSILLALMASGFNGQNFVFHGYLPIQDKDRIRELRLIEQNARALNQTQIFIETPYRNNKMLQSILDACAKDTLLCLGINITSKEERILTKSIGDWKKKIPDLHKIPVVFLLFRY